jgi:two-component system, NarL family, invasion response regulator UvrY
MKILIVDDHTIFRDGVKRILAEQFGDSLFGDAANATEALEQVWKKNWDIVLLDIKMQGRSGLDVLKEIRSSVPGVPVLMLSGHPEEQYAIRVLRAGASGYLTKESASQELCNAVRKVLNGGKYISANVAEQLAEQITAPYKAPHEALSLPADGAGSVEKAVQGWFQESWRENCRMGIEDRSPLPWRSLFWFQGAHPEAVHGGCEAPGNFWTPYLCRGESNDHPGFGSRTANDPPGQGLYRRPLRRSPKSGGDCRGDARQHFLLLQNV